MGSRPLSSTTEPRADAARPGPRHLRGRSRADPGDRGPRFRRRPEPARSTDRAERVRRCRAGGSSLCPHGRLHISRWVLGGSGGHAGGHTRPAAWRPTADTSMARADAPSGSICPRSFHRHSAVYRATSRFRSGTHDRPSSPAILGLRTQKTAALGVATNDSDIALPYSLLALDPHGCGTNKINGNGATVTTNGTVHIDSDCSSDAILLSGTGVLNSPECDVVGQIQTSGGAHDNCAAAPTGVLVSGDPLANLPPPAKPALPAAVQPLDRCARDRSRMAVPEAPRRRPRRLRRRARSRPEMPSTASPIGSFPATTQAASRTSRSTVYMSPGIYWIGGGGVTVKSTGGQNGHADQQGPRRQHRDDRIGRRPDLQLRRSRARGRLRRCRLLRAHRHEWRDPARSSALNPIQTTLYKGMTIFVDRSRPSVAGTTSS